MNAYRIQDDTQEHSSVSSCLKLACQHVSLNRWSYMGLESYQAMASIQ
jgi:hypothetical protein